MNTELQDTVKGLMNAVAEQAEREAQMPYLSRRKEPLGKFDLEWNPQPEVFRSDEFLKRGKLASVILVPERFVQHVKASKRISELMEWCFHEPLTATGFLGHFGGSPVFSDHMALANSRNPKDAFLFVGAKYGAYAD